MKLRYYGFGKRQSKMLAVCRLLLVEHFQFIKWLNMDIFVRVKIEVNRIDFFTTLSENIYMPISKNVMRIFALLCTQFGCSVSHSSPVRDCPAGRRMYLGRSYAAASTTELQAALRTVVTAVPQLFSCDLLLCRSGKICPSGLAIALPPQRS